MTEPLCVSQLSAKFGQRAVLDTISFTVRGGEIAGLLGPNGAGKSTLLRIICGLQSPSHGQALIFGKAISAHRPPVRLLGSMLNSDWIDSRLTTVAAVRIQLARLRQRWTPDRIRRSLDEAGLAHVSRRRVAKLSTGMRQRLALCIATLGAPCLLLLDEPLNGIDAEGVVWLRKFLRDFANRGGAVVVSSHLMAETELFADRILFLREGKLLADENLSHLQAKGQATVFRVVGDPTSFVRALVEDEEVSVEAAADGAYVTTAMEPAQVFDAAVRYGASLSQLGHYKRSLEEIYLDLESAGI